MCTFTSKICKKERSNFKNTILTPSNNQENNYHFESFADNFIENLENDRSVMLSEINHMRVKEAKLMVLEDSNNLVINIYNIFNLLIEK